MLNSVTEDAAAPQPARVRTTGVGSCSASASGCWWRNPIQDLSLDAVAAEVGISRSLLFHYFPTEDRLLDAVIDAAVRRVSATSLPTRTWHRTSR